MSLNEYECKKITISTYVNRNNIITIIIADNGSGISPANLKNIFSFGFTTKETGHGYGLHSSARAVQKLGGNMYAESEGEGKGARFILEIPYGDQA